jgi:hypothetical protein
MDDLGLSGSVVPANTLSSYPPPLRASFPLPSVLSFLSRVA